MMSVIEYAQEIDKKVDDLIRICNSLNIFVNKEDDLLSEEDIIELDNFLLTYEEDEKYENKANEIIKDKSMSIDTTQNKEKLKKKPDFSKPIIKKDLVDKKKEMYKNKEKLMVNAENESIVLYKENMTIGELATALNVASSEIIKKLFLLGIMSNINSVVTYEQAELLVIDYNKELKKEETADVKNFEEYEVVDNEANLVERPPVVTIMGHVDHGKTTLLDTLRNTNVTAQEAGGITQAISAYQVEKNGKKITFIDTPGHAAFTEMRARGASVTDIVIIIVAADDGVMPQTKEAIDHAKAAGVPIVVAINKIDKPGSNVERIMTELSEYGLMPDTWGGETLYSQISALTGEGLDDLLSNILLISEMNNYRSNPNRYAIGTVIESRLDKHVGPIVTLLIQNGTLRLGDPIVVGHVFGKVRTLKNNLGTEITHASPSQPVEITGLSEVPVAGDRFMAFETEKEARSIAEFRKEKYKTNNRITKDSVTLDELFSKIQEGYKEVNVIVKTDVHGSSEAVKSMLTQLNIDGVKINVLRSTVGNITESDVVLAKASSAIIIGFNLKVNAQIKEYAKTSGVEIRTYEIIYKIVEDMEAAMKGMLDPVYEEKMLGTAIVRQIFKFSKVGAIAGSYVTDGSIKHTAKARVLRADKVVYEGSINTLQREKETVKEVKKGFECGITLVDFNELQVDDIIQAYEMVQVK